MKIVNSINCTECNVPDYIEHFFCYCKLVQPIWKEVEKDILVNFKAKITIDDKIILLGFLGKEGLSKATVNQINLAIAVCKMCISKFKYGKKRHLLEIYETECRFRNIWCNY